MGFVAGLCPQRGAVVCDALIGFKPLSWENDNDEEAT